MVILQIFLILPKNIERRAKGNMTNRQKIQNNLDTVQVLESLKFRATVRYCNTQSKHKYKIHADACNLEIDGVGILNGKFDDQIRGELNEKIININNYIKQQLAPIIDDQKEEIKKLL